MSDTYWNQQGRYQEAQERLFDKLVPGEGEADTDHGELLRAICAIYYDAYNNGGCNFELPHFGKHVKTIEVHSSSILMRIRKEDSLKRCMGMLREFQESTKESTQDKRYWDVPDLPMPMLLTSNAPVFFSALEDVTDAVVWIVSERDRGAMTGLVQA